MTDYIQVKDYERFQHYKDRDPPWIKLYVRLLEDYSFSKLPDALKWHVVGCWILASKMENKIPADAVFIGNRIGVSIPVSINELLSSGFLQPWDPAEARGKREDWPTRYIPKEVRAEVLATGQCAECGTKEHLEVDHILPVSRGGTGTRKNLQALCRKCNRIKRARIAETEAPQTLRRQTDLRTTETEEEAELKTETETTVAAGAAAEVTHRDCLKLTIEKLYLGNRPADAVMRTEGSLARSLGSRFGYDRLARAIEGLARRRDSGELSNVSRRQTMSLKWLNSAKFDVNQLAASEDAYYRSDPEPRRGRGKVTDIGDIVASITPRAG